MTLKEAKKETQKTKKEVREVEQEPQEPINLAIRLDSDMRVLEDLYRVVRQNPGKRELKITIISKLQNVVIDSAIRVDGKLIAALEGNEFVDIIAS
jgi:DNA polymerase-3 subunit alpha